MVSVLSVEGLSFRYGTAKVLDEVSFRVEDSDFVGLVGPNGSGKTTLLKIILGLLPVQSGKVKLLGKSIDRFNNWQKVGYVPQRAGNVDEDFPASVREVVLSGLLATKRIPRKYSADDVRKAHEALASVEMESFASRRIGELSGGQKQRVLIARALVSGPRLLVLDEPTAGVDQKTQGSFYSLLGRLHKSGIAIIIVSHDLDRITHHVTKVASLNTKLQFYGSHEEFCRHPDNEHDHHCLKLPEG